MKRRLLFLVFATSLIAFGQIRDFFPWWETPIARDLNLSDDQTQKIQAIVREYRDRLIDLRANVEKSDNQLTDLVNEDHPDSQKVNAAIERILTARTELTRAVAQMGFRLRMVLTPQQWKELQKRRPLPQRFGPDGAGPRPPLRKGDPRRPLPEDEE